MILEEVGDGFAKYHLNHIDAPVQMPWLSRPVLHHFTKPDLGDPHDHPWPFTTFIVEGSYVEEVFALQADGRVRQIDELVRRAGEAHDVDASHIHRIVHLPFGACLTLAVYGKHIGREARWYSIAGD